MARAKVKGKVSASQKASSKGKEKVKGNSGTRVALASFGRTLAQTSFLVAASLAHALRSIVNMRGFFVHLLCLQKRRVRSTHAACLEPKCLKRSKVNTMCSTATARVAPEMLTKLVERNAMILMTARQWTQTGVFVLRRSMKKLSVRQIPWRRS